MDKGHIIMIGVLNAYLIDEVQFPDQKEYAPICRDFLQQNFPKENIFFYDIVKGVWPKTPQECRAWIITGSAKSAYDSDPWILQLKEFIKESHQSNVPIVGICFGHQILAETLGGKVERSPKGWGLGVRSFDIITPTTTAGSSLKSFQPPEWMTPSITRASLLFSHQDQVTQLPEEAQVLAGDDFCPIQMFQLGHHILGMQGHPEFTADFSNKRLEATRDKLNAKVYQTAKESLDQDTDAEVFGRWISEFLKNHL